MESVNIIPWVGLHGAVFMVFSVGMELFAWFTHKYVMHGFLWVLHRDHHLPHKGTFEKNDLFVVMFATPAALAIMLGIYFGNSMVVAMGAGITAYGIGYMLFHDVMFHRRIRWLKLYKLAHRYNYFASIVNAHRNHHKHQDQFETESFGFLYPPKKYRTKAVPPTGDSSGKVQPPSGA